MKKKDSRLVFSIIVVLTTIFLLSIPAVPQYRTDLIDLNENRDLYTTDIKVVTNITLILNFHDGENVTYSNLSLVGESPIAISPYNATVVALGHGNIEETLFAYGVFIKELCINGTWYKNGDDGRNWLINVDGSFLGVSSSVYELNNNSIVEWKFVGGNPYGDENDPTDEFWLYLGILGILTLFAIGIFIFVKRGFKFD